METKSLLDSIARKLKHEDFFLVLYPDMSGHITRCSFYKDGKYNDYQDIFCFDTMDQLQTWINK